MPRTSLFLASVLSLCLAAPSVAQEKQQNKQQQNKQNQKQNKQKNQNQNKKNQNQSQQLVDVSLQDGQTISMPTGGELLDLTVAVPDTVRSGQRYRYRARVSNRSDNITLANVKLVQINGQQVDIEDAQLKNQKNKKNQQGQKNQNQHQKGQKNQGQKQNAQQGQQNQDQQSAEGNNHSWSLGQLKPGESQELAVTAIANQSGQLEHCFAVQYDEVLCTQVKVINPDVTITKSGPDQALVCEVFEYKYTVKNTGTGVAKNFIVRDKLPKGMMTESGKESLEFRVPDLRQGQSETYVAEVHSMKPGEFSSRAMVEQRGGETARSEEVTTQINAPELDVQISGPRAFKVGEGANFDVIVQNTSDVPARNVVLNVDPGKNADVTRAGQGDARDGGRTYRYNIGDLEAGGEQSVSISLDAKRQQGNQDQDDEEQDSQRQQTVQIQATAKALCEREQQEDTAVAEAQAEMQSRALRLTSLLLTVVDMDDVIPQGNNVTYRIRVRNQGSFPDKNVKVNLRLPSGLQFTEASGPSDANANGRRVNLGTVDEIAPGETLEWQVTTTAESTGEQVVAGTLDSEALSRTIEAEEITTIYDGSKQQSGGTDTANKNQGGTQRN